MRSSMNFNEEEENVCNKFEEKDNSKTSEDLEGASFSFNNYSKTSEITSINQQLITPLNSPQNIYTSTGGSTSYEGTPSFYHPPPYKGPPIQHPSYDVHPPTISFNTNPLLHHQSIHQQQQTSYLHEQQPNTPYPPHYQIPTSYQKHGGPPPHQLHQLQYSSIHNIRTPNMMYPYMMGSTTQINSRMQDAYYSREAAANTYSDGGQSNAVGVPESWESLGGTSWYRVETSQGLNYFYNKRTNESTWICPPEIEPLVRQLDNPTSRQPSDQQPSTAAPSPPLEASTSSIEDKTSEGIRNNTVDEESNSSSEEETSNAMKEQLHRMQQFKELLREKQFGKFASYNKCLPKLVYESRFLAIPSDERCQLFDKCVKEMEEEKRKGRKESVDSFRELQDLIAAEGYLRSSSTYEAIAKRYGKDSRWIGNGSTEWDAIRRKLIHEKIRERQIIKEKRKDAARLEFKSLLRERLSDVPSEEWPSIRKDMKSDARYFKVSSATERDALFKQVSSELLSKLNGKRRRDESTEEETLEEHRRKLLKSDAESKFMNMLVERIKNPYLLDKTKDNEGETGGAMPQHLLNGDTRYHNTHLSDADKEKLYQTFVDEFKVERLKLLDQKLSNLSYDDVNCGMHEILESIGDMRFFHGIPEKDLQGGIEKWKRKMLMEMKEAFVTYLKQSPEITYDCEVQGPKFDQLIDKLKGDIRFKRLEFVEAERSNLIKERIREITTEHNRVKNENLLTRFVKS